MKNYRFLKIFFAIALCIICFVLFPTEAKAASEKDLTFTLNSKGDSYTVSDCNEDASGALEIPATYNGMPVNAIGEGAFLNCSKLTSIIIPDSVTDICGGVFSGCSSLESMTVPLSDMYPFGIFFGTQIYTGGVATEQKFNDYDTENPGTFFETCYIPASLKSVTVTNGVIMDAFYNCSNLTTIILSDKVSTISDLAFYNCKNLSEIRVSENNKNFYSDSNGVLYNASKTRLIFASKTLADNYTIPSSVTSIDPGAFYGCSSLKSLTIPLVSFTTKKVTHYPYYEKQYYYYPFGYIFGTTYFNGSIEIKQIASTNEIESEYYEKYYLPASLTSVTVTGDIASYAFSGCSNLTDIVISDKVTYIGGSAFYGCDGLTEVTIPSSVTSIGSNSFKDCDNLSKVTIANGVKSIGSGAFENCVSLSEITIPGSVTTIGGNAFANCDSLTEVNIPASVTKIDSNPFCGCDNLTGIWVAEENSEFSNDSLGVLFSKHKSRLISFPVGLSDTYTIPDSVATVESRAFAESKNLKGIVIPISVTTLKDNAFYECNNLADVYYGGTGSQWEQLILGKSVPKSATIHFESAGPAAQPTEPVNDPTVAATNATSNPTTATSKPTTAPTKPTKAPTAATTKPTAPAAKPTQKPTTAPNRPTTPSTEPSVQTTQPDTLPTEQPVAPEIEATEETTVQAIDPTDPITDTSSTPNNKSAGIPWWWLLIVGVVCIGGGAAVAIIILKKKK